MSLLTLFQLNLGSARQAINYDLLRGKALFAEPLPRLMTADKRPGPMMAEALSRRIAA